MRPDERKIKNLECRVIYTCSILAGIITLLISLARAFSVNNLVIGSATNDISKHFSTSVIIGWSLSSCMLALVGIWILFLSRELKKMQRRAWWQALIISGVFILFGSGFWVRYPTSIHLPGFILLGLLLFIPLVLFTRKFKSV